MIAMIALPAMPGLPHGHDLVFNHLFDRLGYDLVFNHLFDRLLRHDRFWFQFRGIFALAKFALCPAILCCLRATFSFSPPGISGPGRISFLYQRRSICISTQICSNFKTTMTRMKRKCRSLFLILMMISRNPSPVVPASTPISLSEGRIRIIIRIMRSTHILLKRKLWGCAPA